MADPLLSIITPAYNEAPNLPVLYERLQKQLADMALDWEWIVVDDHSTDETFAVLRDMAAEDGRVCGLRLARNSGSHLALTCGLHHAGGDAAVVMAADLQDPPETLPDLVKRWREGWQVVWAVRSNSSGAHMALRGFARLYYWLMRHLVGIKEMPGNGADFFLLDRRVIDAFKQFRERNVSMLALITWMGFRQTAITYEKQARLYGRSGWSLSKKFKLVIDSITSFSYLPLRLISAFGMGVALLGFAFAVFTFIRALGGIPIQGWASLMVAVLVIGGVQMLMMGVLGEYLWRALDESRHRPMYFIEAMTAPTEDNS